MKEITQLNEIARTHKSRRICGGSSANLLPQVCVPGTKATFLQAMRSLQQEALLSLRLTGLPFLLQSWGMVFCDGRRSHRLHAYPVPGI